VVKGQSPAGGFCNSGLDSSGRKHTEALCVKSGEVFLGGVFGFVYKPFARPWHSPKKGPSQKFHQFSKSSLDFIDKPVTI
jgi:hypothetical protein